MKGYHNFLARFGKDSFFFDGNTTAQEYARAMLGGAQPIKSSGVGELKWCCTLPLACLAGILSCCGLRDNRVTGALQMRANYRLSRGLATSRDLYSDGIMTENEKKLIRRLHRTLVNSEPKRMREIVAKRRDR